MEPLLSLNGITKSFGKRKVLDNLFLDLYPKEIVGLIGRSGCGKSTLIKVLVGYYTPDHGQIIYIKKNITKKFSRVKDIVGYTTQENSFYEKLTVYENMAYYANLYNITGKDKKVRIKELLEVVKLHGARNVLAGDISGGMKRRLDFAISLLHRPKLVILDEPTTGLDPVLVDNFWKIVTDIVQKQNITVLVSSHLLSEVKDNCARAAVLHQGKIHMMKITESMDIDSKFKEMTE
ncbi:MAG: ABC transporter ATP-binding protein [Nanoarchaeota archaeon]|nr:ABC transporter ATP-binding protein [Nanoarchaeota archaeon]